MSIDRYRSNAADNIRIVKGQRLVTPASETYNLIRIPHRALLLDLWILVDTAFDGTTPATITLGFTGNGETADPDAFMTNTQVAPGTVGIKRMISGSAAWADGKYFNSKSGIITATVVINDSVAGAFTVFAEYSIIF